MLDITYDNDMFLIWNGREFIRQVTELELRQFKNKIFKAIHNLEVTKAQEAKEKYFAGFNGKPPTAKDLTKDLPQVKVRHFRAKLTEIKCPPPDSRNGNSPKQRALKLPEEDEDFKPNCVDCGNPLTLVRPGKYQCDTRTCPGKMLRRLYQMEENIRILERDKKNKE